MQLVIIGLLLLIILSQCKVKKEIPLVLFPFDYPEDVTEAGKPDFIKNYTKGQVLYGIHCAKCHNQMVDGKSEIPNFSLPQLMDYEIRIQYPSHQDPMRETNLPAEELEQVITFLRYKRKS